MAEERDESEVLEVESLGVKVSIERAVLADDIDTLELLADVDDGQVLKTPRLLRHILGDSQYEDVKAALAVDGRTGVSSMAEFIAGVFAAIGDTAKN